MNDRRTCEHNNLRQTVQVTFSVTVGAWNKTLTKQAIRSKDVQIEEVVWDDDNNHTYCVDCGLGMMSQPLYKEIDYITQRNNNPTGKINRIKALRELVGCGLMEAKYFVDNIYINMGGGGEYAHLQDMTVEDAKNIINQYGYKMYNEVLMLWRKGNV